MAITTYAELQAAAANWLVRGDLTARIPEFIALAEVRLNRLLRVGAAETDVAVTLAAGSRTAPLPVGFTEALRLWLEQPAGRIELRFAEASLIGLVSLQGEPACWTVDGPNLVFDRPADRPYALTLRLLRSFTLSDAQPTNALLTEHPDVYLFATLCEAAPFLRDGELSDAYETRLARAVEEANRKAARGRAARTLTTELPVLDRAAG